MRNMHMASFEEESDASDFVHQPFLCYSVHLCCVQSQNINMLIQSTILRFMSTDLG